MNYNELTFGFVGLGLIGGSIAKAIRLHYPDCRIIAYNPSPDTLEQALSEGVINTACSRIDSSFLACDIIFLCAPVAHNAENLKLLKPFLKENAILTDIGSTKMDIHRHILENDLASDFIGGHPMTGSERTRYRNSRPELLENAYYIIAPEQETPPEKVQLFEKLISSLGALTLIIPCDIHDYCVAAISHLPHVVSAALVNLVRESDSPEGLMKMIAAGGFKDITRISSSSPVMWQQICMTNSENIVRLLDDYIASLSEVRSMITAHSSAELYHFFDSARQYRDSFQAAPSGPIQKQYIIAVNILDHPGGIAQIVDLLAERNVNIKNIGITHNREYQEGVLRIELWNEAEQTAASEILKKKGFLVI